MGGFGGRRGDTETFYSFTSYTVPGRIYRYDLARPAKARSGASRRWISTPTTTKRKQVFYPEQGRHARADVHHASQGAEARRPELRRCSTATAGFNISLTPGFSVANLVWMEMGGVYAVPNLRGGGEYGEDWHQAGTKLQKQNVFDDFIAAAEWLIANEYTSPAKLAISGGSNGGLLVGACLTQRPDLFGAALPAVGVMDMLRFHKFTIGWAWTSDYGSADNADEFQRSGPTRRCTTCKPGTQYPATLITTADHDDRVVPAHSFKFAAALQAAQAGPDARVDPHRNQGRPRGRQADDETDRRERGQAGVFVF